MRRDEAIPTALVFVALAISARADDRFKLNVVLDGRVLTTPASTSFLDEGLGKTRYGQKPRAVEAKLAQAALLGLVELRPDLTIRAHVNIDAEHNFHRRVDLVEGVIRYNPAIGDTASLDVRAGLFFPTVSLENTDLAWLSPYTTTFSAINSWIGEEVRSLGAEAGPSFRISEAQLRLFGAVTRGNDPNGTLLAWRGFALLRANRDPRPGPQRRDAHGRRPARPQRRGGEVPGRVPAGVVDGVGGGEAPADPAIRRFPSAGSRRLQGRGSQ